LSVAANDANGVRASDTRTIAARGGLSFEDGSRWGCRSSPSRCREKFTSGGLWLNRENRESSSRILRQGCLVLDLCHLSANRGKQVRRRMWVKPKTASNIRDADPGSGTDCGSNPARRLPPTPNTLGSPLWKSACQVLELSDAFPMPADVYSCIKGP
jgi:hypothetical protein